MAKKYYSRSEKEKLAKKLAAVVAVFVIVCTATVVIATDGSIDEVANAEVVLKEGAAVKQGDPLTIGRWNVAVIAG